jgi:hypothetical protein
MATLHGTIEADVPPDFADREWREFVGRSMYRSYPPEYRDVASSITDIDAYDGTVAFLREPNGATKVAVDLEYTPHDPQRPEEDVRSTQERLQRELEKYRAFVLRRCELEQCRTAA